jgi:hypothetical protein
VVGFVPQVATNDTVIATGRATVFRRKAPPLAGV